MAAARCSHACVSRCLGTIAVRNVPRHHDTEPEKSCSQDSSASKPDRRIRFDKGIYCIGIPYWLQNGDILRNEAGWKRCSQCRFDLKKCRCSITKPRIGEFDEETVEPLNEGDMLSYKQLDPDMLPQRAPVRKDQIRLGIEADIASKYAGQTDQHNSLHVALHEHVASLMAEILEIQVNRSLELDTDHTDRGIRDHHLISFGTD